MRKSFTRFLSLFILFSIFSLFAVAVAPTVTTWGPANPGLNVAHNGNSRIVTLTMTFDQAVQPGGSGTGIIAVSTNTGVQLDPIQISSNNSVNAVGSTATIVNKVVTIEFHYGPASGYDLVEGTTYQVTATGDALRLKDAPDVPGNYWAGIPFAGAGNWAITIADETKPTVAIVGGVPQFTPRDGSLLAVLGANLTVTFSEPILKGTGNIGLYTEVGDLVEIFDVATSPKVTVAANTLTIDPTNNLLEFQKYYVRIGPLAIKDISTNANKYVGINDNGTWNFQAQDATPPTANLTAGVAVTHVDVQKLEKPKLTFVDNVQNNTFYPATLTLQKSGLTALAVNENVTARFAMTENGGGFAGFTATYKGNNVVEFAPTAAAGWLSNAVYVISYAGAASQFADNQGNLNNGATTYTFTAGDLLPPVFTALGAVPATTTAAYLNTTTLYLSTTMSDPSSLALPGLPVTVKYLVVPDGATVTVQNIIDNGIVLPRKSLGGGAYSTTDHEAWITQTNAGVTFASGTLYDVYYIAIDNATVPNTSSTTAANVQNVLTNDILPPTYVVTTVGEGGAPALTIAPAGSVANVDKDGVITITFNEALTGLAVGDVTVKYNTVGSTWVTLADGGVDYTSAIDGTNKIVTITPVHRDVFGNGWKSLSNYQVIVNANKFKDTFAASPNFAVTGTFSFSTEDFEGPVSTFKSSGNAAALQGRTNVAKTDNLLVTFTEAPRDEFGVLLTNTNIKNYITVRKGDGAAVNVGSTDINANVDMSISGNVVTINPNADFDSEIYYGVWVSTLIEDEDGATGTKLNMYQDNVTPIAGTSEFATFKAIDSSSPLITFNTRDNANLAFTGLVDVAIDAKPYIFLSEQVRTTIGGGVAILDDNQIRSLIELRKNNANGDLINFNVVDVDGAPNAMYGVSNTGTVIVIDPIDFPGTYNYDGSSTYYVSITGLQDIVGNPVSGNATFSTISTANLTTQSITPVINATQVPVAGNVVINFDRNVAKVGVVTNLFLDGAGAAADVTVDVSTLNPLVTVVGSTVTIPYAGLTPNTAYSITLPAGAFLAVNNSKPSAAINPATQKFTSIDAQGPRVDLTNGAGATPMGAASAPISGAKLTLNFDEEVFLGTGIIYIRKAEVGVATTVATIDLLSANFSWGNVAHTILNVNIPVLLEYGTKYIVEIPATAFKDKYNNNWEWLDAATPAPSAADDTYGNRAVVATAFAGAYALNTSVWDFETVSDAVPAFDLANCVPKQNANDVDVTTGLTIAFTEPMFLNAGVHMLTIFRADLPGSPQTMDLSTTPITWNGTNTEATIAGTLINDLVDVKNYYINIDAGAFKSVTNQLSPALNSDNLPHAAAHDWYFTTVDATLPVLTGVSYSPANAGTEVDVDANIILTFSEPVSPVTNWITSVNIAPAIAGLANGNFTVSGSTVTINPPVDMAQSTLYTMTLVAGQTKDAAGNTNLLVTRTFTTEDTALPVVAGNTAVAPYSTTKLKVDLTIQDFTRVTGTVNDIKVYYLVTADNLYSAATITPTIVKNSGVSFDVEHNTSRQFEISGLLEKHSYDVWFVAVDKSKNANETVPFKLDETLVNCATTDGTAPAISLLTPANGYQYVSYGGAGAQFKIKWSEQIALSGNGSRAFIRKKSDNTLVATVLQAAMTVGNSAAGFTNDQVSFTVPGLADVTEYYAELENGLVKDVYNTVWGASVPDNLTNAVYIGNTNWSFKTADERKPLLIANTNPALGAVRLTPADGAGMVAVGTANSLFMVFDEDIQKNTATASWIKIYRVGTAAAFEVIPVSGADVIVGADKRTVEIKRHNIYTSEYNYFVVVDNNAFFDYAAPAPSNYFAGLAIQAVGGAPTDVNLGNVATELWNYTTLDNTAPVTQFFYDDGVTAFSAAKVDPTVDINTGIKIKFWDPIASAFEPLFKDAVAAPAVITSYVQVTKTGGVIVPSTSAYAAGVITVTPTTPLTSNETYTVTLTGGTGAGALEDDAANEIGTQSVTFTTDDRLSPVVTITATQTNAASPSQILVGTKFRVTFDKKVLKAQDGADVDINVSPTAADLNNAAYLTLNGVAFTGTVTDISTATQSIYELTPAVTLAGQTAYAFVWTANAGVAHTQTVKDELYFPNGNVLNRTLAQCTFNFTTEDVTNPLRTALNPVHVAAPAAATIINATDKLTISFNELVTYNDAAGKITIRYSNGQIFDEILPSACSYADIVGPNFDVVITPNKNFDPFREYYVEIPAGAITDKSFNKRPYAGFLGNTTWRFATDDGVAPTVAIYSPANNTTGVAINSNLVLTFSENVVLGAAGKNLVIYFNNGDTPDGNAIETIDVTDAAKVSISGSNLADPNKLSDVVTINPATNFNFTAPGQYYIRIDQGFVVDRAFVPNSYAGIHDNLTWKFNIADPTEPNLVAPFIPANGAVGVGKTLTSVSMKFDRDIMVGAGTIRLYQYNYNAVTFNETTKLIESIPAGSASINHTTNTVTFDFPSTLTTPLLDNTIYYILADNGSFTNTTSTHNWWAGISNPFTWRFTTGDNSAPTVVATLGAGVNPLATPNVFDVTLTFDGAVTGVNATNVTITGGTVALSTVSPTVYKATITALDLAAVKLSLSAGIKDLALNSFVAQDFNYKVADNNAPTLVATPNGGAIATNVFTVNLLFNEPVVGVDATSITVNNGATKVVSGSGAAYQVVVTAQSNSVVTMSFANTIVDVIDPVSNPVAHPFVGLPLTFTVTGDALAPTIAMLTPADGTGVTPETGVLRNPNLSIQFSEAVVVGTAGAKVKVYKQDVSASNTLVSQTTINAAMISADGLTLTVPTIDPLTDNTDYVVLVDAGIVKSTLGVNFAGIADPVIWNFKTGDNTAPILTITDDQTNDLKTKQDILVTLQFNEAVWGVAGAVSVTGASATPVITGVDGDMIYTVAIKAADLADVSLTVSTAVTDKFGRNHLSLPQTVNFKVGDNTKPTVVVTGNVVANTVTATLTFNENVFGVASAITATGTTGAPVVAGADGGSVYTVIMNAADGASVLVKSANTIADASGNLMDAATYGPFNVGDNTAPTATVDPESGSTNMKKDFTVSIAFNELVVVPEGAINVTGGTYVVTAPVTGNTYTVAISANDGAVVTVNVTGAVKDASNNVFVAKSYTYIVGDNTAPTAIVNPNSGVGGLTNTFNVDVTFNETVTVPEGAISVSENATATVQAPVSGNTYRVSITAADAAIVTLKVSSAVKDASGNAFVAKEYIYTVGDNTKPFVVDGGFKPADGDRNVKGSPISLELTFNENVFAGSSAELKVYEQTVSSTNQLVFSTSITPAMISGKVVTVPVLYTLKDNTSYTVTVADGIVKDASNNVFATGFTDPTRWNFETGDNTAPTVVSVEPTTATAAKQTFDVNIEFSEGVVNVNNSTITVDKGTVVVSPVGLTGKLYKATITAADGDVVTLSIGTGIKDTSERNQLAAVVTRTYTIGDNTAPTLAVTAPVAPVAKTFTVGLKFSEVVTGVSASTINVVGGTLSTLTGSGAEYTLSISAEEEALVKINVPNTVADLAGNLFAGKDLEYTVGDFTAPIVTAEPSTGDNLKKNFSVVLTFSADAIVATSNITATGGTIVVNPIVGNVCTVDVTAADMSTVVLSVASTVADEAGNKIAGTTSFTYKVGDNTAPTLVITGPSVPIETTFIVSFKFNEIVTGFSRTALTITNGTIKQVVGSGTDYLVSISAAEKAVVTIKVTDSVVDSNGNKFAGKEAKFTVGDFSAPVVTVTPPSTPVGTVFSIGLKFDEAVNGLLFGGSAVTVTNGKIVDITGQNDTYTIVVSAKEMTSVTVVLNDAIVDLAGNKFAGQTLNYTTGDFTAPQLVVMTPTLDDVLANNHPTFKMTFSENVILGAGGKLVVYKVNTTTPALTIPITVDMIVGKVVTVNYTTTSGLDKNARYYVLVDGTALTDNAGNAFAGVSDAAAWTFKTGGQFITITDPNSSLEFKVYPNPFVDFVNVANASQLSKVVVTNIAGQVVKEVVTPTDRIQLNELRSGIYFMSLYNTDNVIVKTAKIVKR